MRRRARSLLVVAALGLLAAAPAARADKAPPLPCLDARESDLPLPSRFAKDDDPAAFQNRLTRSLVAGEYERLGWCRDKAGRGTGRSLDRTYYGTHPVVRAGYWPSFAR